MKLKDVGSSKNPTKHSIDDVIRYTFFNQSARQWRGEVRAVRELPWKIMPMNLYFINSYRAQRVIGQFNLQHNNGNANKHC